MARVPADLQALIDRLEPDIRKAFIEAINDVRSAAQMGLLADAVERQDIAAIMRILAIEPSAFAPLDRAMASAYIQGGIAALSGLPVIPDPETGGK